MHGWWTSGSCNLAWPRSGNQELGPHIRDDEPCWPPENWQGSQMPLVISVPAEVTCAWVQTVAVTWHTGPTRSEMCPWGPRAKCGGVCARVCKRLRSDLQKNREACCCLPVLHDHFCLWLSILEFIGIWLVNKSTQSWCSFTFHFQRGVPVSGPSSASARAQCPACCCVVGGITHWITSVAPCSVSTNSR